MAVTFDYTTTLYVETCCNCGMLFGMPAEVQRRLKREGGNFYCPNGHSQHYVETEEAKLRKLLEQEQKRHSVTQMELTVAKQRVKSVEAAKKRVEKRVKNGVCPCCNRQFVQLTRHMKSKHPEYQG